MNKYICECCGGQINRTTLKCEYCGTEYKIDNDNFIRIETFRNPIDTYKAIITLSDEFISHVDNEDLARMTMNNLTHKLASALANNIVLEVEQDPFRRQTTVKGTIKCIRPAQGASHWGE